MKEQANSPLVSIGVPVVKSDYLEKCLTCVLNQSYDNFEVIIVNNAKNTQEGNIIESIVKNFNNSKIQYFRNDLQLPIIENWNKTLHLSNGCFFAILCDDDFWETDFIETMVNLSFRYPNVNVFHCRCLIIDENENPINISPICPEFEDILDFIYHRIKGLRIQFLSDFFVRTLALKEIRGFVQIPDGWGSDDLTFFHLAFAEGIVYSSKTLCHYRDTPVSVTNTMKIKNKIIATELYCSSVSDLIKDSINSGSNNDIMYHLIMKQLKEFKKNRIVYFKAQYLKKKFMLNRFMYRIILIFIKIRIRKTQKI